MLQYYGVIEVTRLDCGSIEATINRCIMNYYYGAIEVLY